MAGAGEDPPRRRVCGRFRVTDHVGSGGFADVWHGVDGDGRDVAVKFPQFGEDATNDPGEVRKRFEQSYRALSTFEGGILPTSLVRFVDGSHDGTTCIVTEFVDGPDLAERIGRPGTSPGTWAARTFGYPVVRALGFLHANGYVYLDCKPENVLVRAEHDRPVLIDFNTAEPAGENRTLFYEDAYKAPEQVPDGHDADSGPHSDVYGAGKLLVYLLTGRTMDTSATPAGGVDVREYGASPPREVAEAVERATRAAPRARYADCRAFVDALYRAEGRDPARATLTDARTDVVCPVRVGDTVGRVAEEGDLPTLAVADPERYVSPVQFAVERDDRGWLVADESLNGTFFDVGDGWRFLLSDRGYRHLSERDHPRVEDDKPHGKLRVVGRTRLAPVDPDYPVQLWFDPE